MALNRRDACSHAMTSGTFVSCVTTYDADYLGRKVVFAIRVAAADLPGNTNPSDAQVQAVSDPKAITAYNSWKANIDTPPSAPADPTVTAHAGQSATIA